MAVNMLIVDDSRVMRSVITKSIKAAGYGNAAFHEAANGLEALGFLKENRVDLVLTDFKMPRMNGMELIVAMKKDSRLSPIPSLVVTTEGDRKTMEKFAAAGAAGYIQKPFTPEAIREKIHVILGEMKDEEVENGDPGLDF